MRVWWCNEHKSNGFGPVDDTDVLPQSQWPACYWATWMVANGLLTGVIGACSPMVQRIVFDPKEAGRIVQRDWEGGGPDTLGGYVLREFYLVPVDEEEQ